MAYSHKKNQSTHNNDQVTKNLRKRGYHKINYKSPAAAYPGASYAGTEMHTSTGPSKNPRVEKLRREMYRR